MRERFRLPVPIGEGLDRHTGTMATGPGAMRDVRNAVLGIGRATARTGFSSTAELVDDDGVPVTAIAGGFPLRSEGVSIVVGYAGHDRELHVFRLDGSGRSPERIGLWFTLAAGAATPPRVTGADVGGLLFLAHDEPTFSKRGPTFVYDPFAAVPLAPLTADLDADGGADGVYARGVVEHIGYLFLWGYGTAAEPNRPETVRNSRPGLPRQLEPNEYGDVGMRGEPVVAAVPWGPGLVLFKASCAFLLGGYKSRNFELQPFDLEHGLAGSRCWIKHAGRLFTWAPTGPREVQPGGGSVDLGLPLELGGPPPAGLAATGEAADGCTAYDASSRQILWIFGQRVYALSLVDPARLRWSYWELGREVGCSWTVPAASNPLPPPTGHPEYSGTTEIVDTAATIEWANTGADGDETVEIWFRPSAGGAWVRGPAALSNTLASQTVPCTGLLPGTAYDVALRYRRGGAYGEGYSDPDPATWPEVSRGTFTTALSAARIASLAWSRTGAAAERVTVAWLAPDPSVRFQVLRLQLATTRSPADPADAVVVHEAAAGAASWDDTTIGGETPYAYWVRPLAADDTPGAPSDPARVWTGPLAPVIEDLYPTALADTYGMGWREGGDAHDGTELWSDQGGPWELVAEIGGDSPYLGVAPGGHTLKLGIRHHRTTFGVTDFSDFDRGEVVPLARHGGGGGIL